MAQLDFREALSTPGENIFSAAVAVPASPQLAAPSSYLPEVGLSRSTWANIVFVAIAAIGGMVSAFYFFNGADLLRAAAAWPAEFLYPRPVSTESLEAAVLPAAVDQYTSDSTSAARKYDAATQDLSDQNFRPVQLAQSPASPETLGSGPSTPPSVVPIVPTILPVVPPSAPSTIPPLGRPVIPPIVPPGIPQPDPILGDVNKLVAGVDTLGQSVSQTINQTVSSVLPNSAPSVSTHNTVGSARKKVTSVRPKVSARATAASSAMHRAQQLPASLQSPGMVNQTMFGGGMGAVSGIGSVGSSSGVSSSGVSSSGVSSSGTGISGVGTPGGTGGPGVVGPGGIGGIGGLNGGLGGIGSGLGGIGGNLGGIGGIGGIGGHH